MEQWALCFFCLGMSEEDIIRKLKNVFYSFPVFILFNFWFEEHTAWLMSTVKLNPYASISIYTNVADIVSLFCAHRDFGVQQRYARFCGRIVVLSVLSLLLYPFLWAWTVIGTLWFTNARSCVSSLTFLCPWKHPLHVNDPKSWVVFNACSCQQDRNGVSSFG